MAFTYDVSTDRGKVRFLITDTDPDHPIMDDTEIDACLSMATDSNIYLAAALALDVLANASARKAFYYSILASNFQCDKRKVPEMLREGAKRLREELYLMSAESYETAVSHLPFHVDRHTGVDESTITESGENAFGLDNWGTRYSHVNDESS